MGIWHMVIMKRTIGFWTFQWNAGTWHGQIIWKHGYHDNEARPMCWNQQNYQWWVSGSNLEKMEPCGSFIEQTGLNWSFGNRPLTRCNKPARWNQHLQGKTWQKRLIGPQSYSDSAGRGIKGNQRAGWTNLLFTSITSKTLTSRLNK